MLVFFWKGEEIFFVYFFQLILPLDDTPSFSVLYFVRFTENSSTSVGEHTDFDTYSSFNFTSDVF